MRGSTWAAGVVLVVVAGVEVVFFAAVVGGDVDRFGAAAFVVGVAATAFGAAAAADGAA